MSETILTPEEVAEISARGEKATPGPWDETEFTPTFELMPGEIGVHVPAHAEAYIQSDGTWHAITICRGMNGANKDANAAFIAAARAWVPSLCATVVALRAERDTLSAESERVRAERDEANKDVSEMLSGIREMKKRNDALRARVTKLEAALRVVRRDYIDLYEGDDGEPDVIARLDAALAADAKEQP